MAMQTTTTITVRGTQELQAKLKMLSMKAKSDLTTQAVKAGAVIVKETIQSHIRGQGLVESGALEKSVLISSGLGGIARQFSVTVSTEVQGGYDKVHEYGAVIKPKTARMLAFEIEGELIFARQVTIPARPFFRPGVEESRVESRAVMAQTWKHLVLSGSGLSK